jgi:GT2 family glycosyltransferase
MYHRVKIIDIELNKPSMNIEDLNGYTAVKAMARLHGTPIGYVQVPVINGQCTDATLRKAILEQYNWPILRHNLIDLLAAPPRSDRLRIADLLNASHPICDQSLPMVTVAVCTRDRPGDLELCLDALGRLDYPNLDLLVVDNAPSNGATENLVCTQFPNVRYVCEPRPGLDWARNRAIIEARGEVVAYTDDDVMVDPGWVRALAVLFSENPEVMAVTGLVVPYELETEAQLFFEWYGGFGRGFERKWYRVNPENDWHWPYHGTGQFGTGANMAFRRTLFDQIGLFDPALDVGTVTNGGGDLEMFFRVLKEGHTLVYEPSAIVRHRHRRDYIKLRTQIANNGIGLYSYFVRSALAYREERSTFIRFGLRWLWWWNIRRLLISFMRPLRLPRDLILVELRGSLTGLGRYQKARRAAAQIVAEFGSQTQSDLELGHKGDEKQNGASKREAIAVRTIDLGQPWFGLTDVTEYSSVRIFVMWADLPLGSVDIVNSGQPLSKTRLIEAIVDNLGLSLLGSDEPQESLWIEAMTTLHRVYLPSDQDARMDIPGELPVEIPVSVVVATHDRPDDLRGCLRSLTAQKSSRKIEIIVVDNNPGSGLTPPVVAEFPGIVLLSERRKGLSYARNAGIVASTGDIIIATDDDVVIPPDWLEKLIAPFSRADVMIVTGNVLPYELDTRAQQFFEHYGGLGRGFKRFEVSGDWFESYRRYAVPTWELGATANAAFRATIFSDPRIGLLDEALGVGTPTGCSEDTLLFYRVLKAGHTLMYEPTAYVWHKHRRDMPALRRQIYSYSKGHVAYHLTTLLQDHDLRALLHIAVHMPIWHIKQLGWQIKDLLRGRRNRDYPLWLTLTEIRGNLAGPWALWRSRRRVKREGYSKPYIPVAQRPAILHELPAIEASQPAMPTVGRRTASGV